MSEVQLLDAIILGILQGLTEFIPVSSSGHLILAGHILHFHYSGLAFDTALDIGTLLALYLYFGRDYLELAHDLMLGGPKRKLAAYILVATVPALVAGALIQKQAETVFRDVRLVALNLIWVGVLMYVVDRYVSQRRGMNQLTLPRVLMIGVAQAVALIPGTSRSGITITAGRAIKFDRVTATRFSFLLSGPVITGATAKVMLKPQDLHQMAEVPWLYLSGILAAFVAGYAAIAFLLKYLSRHGLAPFAVYRILVGILILAAGLR